QWAAMENAIRQTAGPDSSVGRVNNWSLGTTASASKLFSTGALLLFSFANTTVFNFNGVPGLTSSSLINLSLLQPLLQGGGKAAPLQVDQVRSTLLQARNTVLKDAQDTANALDQLKLQLGIPANLPLLLDDTQGRPVTSQLDRYYAVLTESDAAARRI